MATTEKVIFEKEDNDIKLEVGNPDHEQEIPFTFYPSEESHTVYLTKEEALNLIKFLIKFV